METQATDPPLFGFLPQAGRLGLTTVACSLVDHLNWPQKNKRSEYYKKNRNVHCFFPYLALPDLSI